MYPNKEPVLGHYYCVFARTMAELLAKGSSRALSEDKEPVIVFESHLQNVSDCSAMGRVRGCH